MPVYFDLNATCVSLSAVYDDHVSAAYLERTQPKTMGRASRSHDGQQRHIVGPLSLSGDDAVQSFCLVQSNVLRHRPKAEPNLLQQTKEAMPWPVMSYDRLNLAKDMA